MVLYGGLFSSKLWPIVLQAACYSPPPQIVSKSYCAQLTHGGSSGPYTTF